MKNKMPLSKPKPNTLLPLLNELNLPRTVADLALTITQGQTACRMAREWSRVERSKSKLCRTLNQQSLENQLHLRETTTLRFHQLLEALPHLPPELRGEFPENTMNALLSSELQQSAILSQAATAQMEQILRQPRGGS